MKKVLKWLLIVMALLVAVLFIGFQVLKTQTKKASPEQTIEYKTGDTELSVFYNRPSKKGRVIFGELVPYGEVWRTGANEATTFSTNKDLLIDGNKLPAGQYTLWTIPEQNEWTVIFNGKMYGWGVNLKAKASRDPKSDILQIKVPVENSTETVEQFTISFVMQEQLQLLLSWDQVRVSVPIDIQ